MANRFNFRVYIKKLNKVYNVCNLMDFGNQVEALDENGDFVLEDEMIYKDDFILMQSTGLTDSKGKEVFEGDILKDVRGIKHIVKWKETAFKTDIAEMIKPDFLKNVEMCKSAMDYYEVIGNIYENKELLG